jgi:hypothetical protein
MTIAARHIDVITEEITCADGMPAFWGIVPAALFFLLAVWL